MKKKIIKKIVKNYIKEIIKKKYKKEINIKQNTELYIHKKTNLAYIIDDVFTIELKKLLNF